MQIIRYCILISAFFGGVSFAQSPREQLSQLATQLQATPSDTALRERIIKLAQEIKPPPAMPEEVERRMARGSAAFKAAKSENDFKDAVREFEQASLAAPWSGDIYYNLGVAHDKAGDYGASIRNLKLAMLAAPDSRETRTLLYEVEYRQEKASSPEAQAVKRQVQGDALLQALDGAVFRLVDSFNATFTVEVRGRTATITRHQGRHNSRLATIEERPRVTGSCRLSVVDGNPQCEAPMVNFGGYRVFIDIATHGQGVWIRWIGPDGKRESPQILNRAN